MAGVASSDSRLGVTLQGYDQVIAYSHANINESLEYHFTANPALCNFDVTLRAGLKESLKGTLNFPRVELVDIENADQALYVLQFANGQFGTFEADEEGDPVKVVRDVKEWKLVSCMDFSLNMMATIPTSIANKIQTPGVDGVDQLLVDFGTADAMQFVWDKSKVTGLSSAEGVVSAQLTISLFVTKWLDGLKHLNPSGSHNVLGYTLEVDPAKANLSLEDALKEANSTAPSFPPTSVRLQTVNYRPGGDADKNQTDHDYNAFLFTKTTEDHEMIKTDLAWSGDLFYESIGGTMIMSRRIFWARFLRLKITDVCANNFNVAIKQVQETAIAEWYAKQANTRYNYQWTRHDGTWVDKGLVCERTGTVSLTAMGNDVVTGVMSFNVESAIKNTLGAVHWRGPYTIDSRVQADHIHPKSVTSIGKLAAEVVSGKGNPLGFDGKPMAAEQNAAALALLDNYKYQYDLKNAVEAALNAGTQFVFPGGGDSDVKDPISDKAGKLMIGLSYKKGEAAK